MPNEQQEHISQDEKKNSPKKEFVSETLRSFKEVFEKEENLEERLKMSIAFMKESLSQATTPRFKDFWEVKKLCLPLFKEKINPLVKTECWNEYTTLSSEAKRLKDLLEEQSSFAIEQIELALQALEKECEQSATIIKTLPSIGNMQQGTFLSGKERFYDEKQQAVQFYSNLSGKMKDLRKEVIETEMRIRDKNRLLKRLSALGDAVLPHRKEQMKLVTQEFVQDVGLFVSTYFDTEKQSLKPTTISYNVLRESIKEFQLLAKCLGLNTRVFSDTRLALSQCWEILRTAEKERKVAFLEKQDKLKQEGEQALGLIEEFSQHFKNHPASTREEIYERVQSVTAELEKRSLLPGDFKTLSARLRKAQEIALEPFVEQEKAHLAKRQEQAEQRSRELELFKEQLQATLMTAHEHTLKSLQDMYHSFDDKVRSLKPDVRESQKLCEGKKELYEVLLLKKEDEVSDQDPSGLEDLLREWESFREMTRVSIERYRKEMGSSGFDFEKAMVFGKQVEIEKSRLDRIVQKISEIEDRLE